MHRPRLLSDRASEGTTGSCPLARGSSYIAGDLAAYLEDKGTKHVRGAPMHLLDCRRSLAIAEWAQTQGNIPSRGLKTNPCQAAERWHQTLKNRILRQN